MGANGIVVSYGVDKREPGLKKATGTDCTASIVVALDWSSISGSEQQQLAQFDTRIQLTNQHHSWMYMNT